MNFIFNIVALANKVAQVFFFLKSTVLTIPKMTQRRISSVQLEAVNTLFHAMKAVRGTTFPESSAEMHASVKSEYVKAPDVITQLSDFVKGFLEVVSLSWQSDARVLMVEMEKNLGNADLQSKADELVGNAELQDQLLAIYDVKLSTFAKEMESQLVLMAKASIKLDSELLAKAKTTVTSAKEVCVLRYAIESIRNLKKKKGEGGNVDMVSAVAAFRKDKLFVLHVVGWAPQHIRNSEA